MWLAFAVGAISVGNALACSQLATSVLAVTGMTVNTALAFIFFLTGFLIATDAAK